MLVTYQNVIDRARVPLNDSAKVRYSDSELNSYLNDGLYAMVGIRSDLFNFDGLIDCVAGTDQTLPEGGVTVLDVYGATIGTAYSGVTRITFNALRTYRSSWRNDPPAICQNWFYAPQDESKQGGPKFFIYPPSPSGQQLQALYLKLPATVSVTAAATTVLPVPDDYSVPLQFYVVGRAEMKDDEHVNTARAQAFASQFEKMVMMANAAEDTTL